METQTPQPFSSLQDLDNLNVSDVRQKHRQELENLTMATQPLRTLRFFVLAIVQVLVRSSWVFLLLVAAMGASIGILVMTSTAGLSHQKVSCYY